MCQWSLAHIDRVDTIMGFSFKTMYGYFARRKKTDAVWFKTMCRYFAGRKKTDHIKEVTILMR